MAPTSPRSVAEHQAQVAALIGTMPVVELPLADCLGLVLAEDLSSPVPLPLFDNSAMDGYAVRSVDIAGADPDHPVELPVTADIPAGSTDIVPLRPGAAHRIMTGAPIPPGADSVVQVELTDGGMPTVRVNAPVRPGTHIRRTGEDVIEGATVLLAGAELGPAQLGLAAAVGTAAARVHRRPRVLVLSTGSELVAAGNPLRAGQIYESNGVLLASAVRTVGGTARQLRLVPDDVTAFHAALEPELDWADLVVTSGGVSAGAYEVVKDALTGQGVEFVRVAMQPGGPQGAGRYRGVPVVTLPGNPVSAAVSFEVFLRPALRAALGHRAAVGPPAVAALTAEVTAPAGKRQYRRGRYEPETGVVSPIGGPGSHLLAALATANCLFVVPEEVVSLPAGAEVEIVPL
ncbi:MAG TPA: gephyrin-like molybdotransferase Glp [Pseudonocardiaceae bacterium]|nr:gephyrin-like molybdotransferase Glp [Pseudonocardiaceae bacterium]